MPERIQHIIEMNLLWILPTVSLFAQAVPSEVASDWLKLAIQVPALGMMAWVVLKVREGDADKEKRFLEHLEAREEREAQRNRNMQDTCHAFQKSEHDRLEKMFDRVGESLDENTKALSAFNSIRTISIPPKT